MLFKLHIADSFVTRMRGLGGVRRFVDADGLLLRFPFPFFWPIWMRSMRLPIDVIWLRRGKVVDMRENLSPKNSYRMYFPRRCADACIELPAGSVQNHKLTTGIKIEFEIVNLEV